MCISAGASVSGASWKMISTPSTTCVSIGCLMICVGGISVTVPPRDDLAEPGIDLAARTLGQHGAELEHGAADHRRAGQHVLLGHLLHEAGRAR